LKFFVECIFFDGNQILVLVQSKQAKSIVVLVFGLTELIDSLQGENPSLRLVDSLNFHSPKAIFVRHGAKDPHHLVIVVVFSIIFLNHEENVIVFTDGDVYGHGGVRTISEIDVTVNTLYSGRFLEQLEVGPVHHEQQVMDHDRKELSFLLFVIHKQKGFYDRLMCVQILVLGKLHIVPQPM
jgi:hypothetical protein